MPTQTLTAKPKALDAAFGAEFIDCDLNAQTDCGWIGDALAEHAVLVFRNQSLDAGQLAALGRKLGEPRPHVLVNYRTADHPEVSMLTNVDADGKVDQFGVSRASAWHSDMTYDSDLPKLAILHSLEVPSKKGGTMFADMRAAYDALPEATKEKMEGLIAVHGGAAGPAGYRRNAPEEGPARADGGHEARHPAVRRHSVTGRKILFVNPMHTMRFEGMPVQESEDLIMELSGNATRDQNTYYHDWAVGDVVIWDEASVVHRNAGDYDPAERRIFFRTIVF